VPDLVLGPLLRYAGETDATVWVETDAACEVEVLGCRSRTFDVEGHHYALVHVSGLEPGGTYEYEVLLDGEKRWPEAGSGFPPSVIHTVVSGAPLKIVFGSCRNVTPHEAPHAWTDEEDDRGLGVDALYAMAARLRDEPAESLPHALVLLGDQIYADEPPYDTIEFIRSRRDMGKPPGEEVANFQEYARLYRDSWREPTIRWLLSTVPSVMTFDDHEVTDDWNISEAWIEEMRTHPWWNEQIIGAYTSYWIYQHLGNLPPRELERNDLFQKVKAADEAGPLLREFAYRTHREPTRARWSFHRDFGETRLVMVDSRGGRVLERGRRLMVDSEGWHWIEEHATGGFDHLLLGTSVPVLPGPGSHYVQAWLETVCSGVWGKRAAEWGEKLRRWQDLEHWGSFYESFAEFVGLVRSVGAGKKGQPPASIIVLSGDVHHGYLAEVTFRNEEVKSPVYQAVCSPFRNYIPKTKWRLEGTGWTKPGKLVGRFLALLVGIGDLGISWRLTHRRKPWLDNQVATLELDGQRAALTFEKAAPSDSGELNLETIYEHHLV